MILFALTLGLFLAKATFGDEMMSMTIPPNQSITKYLLMKNRLLLILCLAVWPVIGTAQLDKTRTWVFGTGIKMKFLQNDSIEIDTIGIDC